MMNIIYIFWMYVMVFAVIGMWRGGAKELLVAFSMILALALNLVLKQYIPLVRDMTDLTGLFWIRTIILLALVFFGYQTVAVIPRLASKANRERLQDALFGAFLGALNGYFIAGTLLFYINDANYPFPNIISAPPPELTNTITAMMTYMPPHILGIPGIYFAVILSFIFVIVVYI